MTPAAAQPEYPSAARVPALPLACRVIFLRAAGQHPELPGDFSSTGMEPHQDATEADGAAKGRRVTAAIAARAGHSFGQGTAA